MCQGSCLQDNEALSKALFPPYWAVIHNLWSLKSAPSASGLHSESLVEEVILSEFVK